MNELALKADILSMTKDELTEFVGTLGFPAFRAKQLFEWMYKGVSIEEMSNLPSAFKEALAQNALYALPVVANKLVSRIDGTVKFLFRLHDGQYVESVVMDYEHGLSICISSQAGCRMDCKFCASTLQGKHRDLLPSELLGQVLVAQKEVGKRISSLVMMGIGEPLDNYDNVLRFLHLITSPDGLNLGARHISLSTCGVVDKIYDLAKENLQITLSISLHAYDDEKRSAIMPVNNKWNIDSLLTACAHYFTVTGRRISFEYTLISGVNDDEEGARKLARLLKSYMRNMPLHVNLIPVNPVEERGFDRSSKERVESFKKTLISEKVNATVRRKLGSDIDASCGQLRHKKRKEEGG
jgi:23S rRNA (adenine2503-C2)-methyltransferase